MAAISLSGATPLAKGGERAIYLDPTNTERLIKVWLPQTQQNKGRLTRAFFKRFAGVQHSMFLIRQEQKEYLRVVLRNIEQPVPLPMAQLYGFVETDLGMGLSTQRVHGPNMEPAPSWRELARNNLVTDREVQALTVFCRSMLALGVRSSDLTASNIVVGHRTISGLMGPYEAVLVDGYGDTHVVPIRTWSSVANRKAITKRFRRLGAMVGYRWDENAQSFSKGSDV